MSHFHWRDRLRPPGSAEPQLGPSRATYYSRGYVPHLDEPHRIQFITYRLRDSLPADVLEQLDATSMRRSVRADPAARRARIDAWLDAGHGSSDLAAHENAQCVVETWKRFDGERYFLIAWVVMPNHVHVLIETLANVRLATIVQSWKSYTGRRIAEWRDSRGRGRSAGGVWMRDYWDRAVRSEVHLWAAVDYVHQNPVKAGLVRVDTDWQWSSARLWAELGLGAPRGRPHRNLPSGAP